MVCQKSCRFGFCTSSRTIKEFNGCEKSEEEFLADLKQRLSSADINQVKSDVLPFIKNTKELEIWSNEYFLQLMDMIKIDRR